MSGWWFRCSARLATRLTQSIAALKSVTLQFGPIDRLPRSILGFLRFHRCPSLPFEANPTNGFFRFKLREQEVLRRTLGTTVQRSADRSPTTPVGAFGPGCSQNSSPSENLFSALFDGVCSGCKDCSLSLLRTFSLKTLH